MFYFQGKKLKWIDLGFSNPVCYHGYTEVTNCRAQKQSDLSCHYGIWLCACGQEVILKTPQTENKALKDIT